MSARETKYARLKKSQHCLTVKLISSFITTCRCVCGIPWYFLHGTFVCDCSKQHEICTQRRIDTYRETAKAKAEWLNAGEIKLGFAMQLYFK